MLDTSTKLFQACAINSLTNHLETIKSEHLLIITLAAPAEEPAAMAVPVMAPIIAVTGSATARIDCTRSSKPTKTCMLDIFIFT